MSKLGINTGNSPNDGQGDPLRIAMGKINSNFTEIYNTLGDGNNVTSYASTAGISTLAQNLTGNPRINVSGVLNSGITTTEHLEVRNITSTGVVTATQFVGDGSQLTNVTALVGGLQVLDDNVRKGVARELNFGSNIESTGPDGVGRVTISVASSIFVTGIVTNATYADVSGVSGIATYATSSGLSTYANIAGIATNATASSYATIAGYSTSSGVSTTTNTIDITNTNGLTTIYYPTFVEDRTTGQYLRADVDLTYRTDTNTLTVGGGITATSIRASGIVTANSFRPSSGYYQSGNGTNAFYVYDGTGNVAFQGNINVNQINSGSGYKTLEFSGETTPVVMVTNGLNITGVTTSSGGFVGNLTGTATTATTSGYATTSGISTLSQGLTGTPNITVGVVTASISIPTQLRTKSVAEKTTLVAGNTVGLAFSTGSGNVAICTSPTGDITLNVTDIPTDSSFDNHSISFSVVVNQTGTARTCTAITLNGVSRTIRWSGGSLANALSGVSTSTGFDIFTFTGINTVGSASTTANYIVLGSVNGGFN